MMNRDFDSWLTAIDVMLPAIFLRKSPDWRRGQTHTGPLRKCLSWVLTPRRTSFVHLLSTTMPCVTSVVRLKWFAAVTRLSAG